MFWKKGEKVNKDIKEDLEKVSVIDVEETKVNVLNQTEILTDVNDLLKYITKLDYVKDMLLDVGKQTEMVESVAASSEEMTATIEDISNFVQNSAGKTVNSIEIANKSIEDIGSSFHQMETTFEQSEKVQETMNKVKDKAVKINEVVSIIKGVADQTNLLALNATIEAARAGENGRGFAVVADEIKKLADNTKEQVNFITTIVNDLTDEINQTSLALSDANNSFEKGKNDMNHTIGSLDELKDDLNAIESNFMEVSANVEEQTAASQEMSSSIMIVNDKTKVISEETNKTGSALNDISKTLNNIRLKLVDGTPGLDMKTQIEICISDHLIWRWRVYNMILGYEKLSEGQVGTHNTCRLGKWCNESKFENPKICSVIDDMKKPHSDLHTLAKKAIGAYNSGNIAKAEEFLGEMDVASERVVECLNKIKKL